MTGPVKIGVGEVRVECFPHQFLSSRSVLLVLTDPPTDGYLLDVAVVTVCGGIRSYSNKNPVMSGSLRGSGSRPRK